MTGLAEQQAALRPLRAALLRRARERGATLLAAAETDGRGVLLAAQQDADRVLAQARALGEAEAAALLAAERAETRRAARGLVLAVQREAYDDLRRQARTAVREQLAEPGNQARLAASLRRRLGDTAAVVAPHPDGGLVARAADGRSADASTGSLVDAVVAELDLEPLWSPG